MVAREQSQNSYKEVIKLSILYRIIDRFIINLFAAYPSHKWRGLRHTFDHYQRLIRIIRGHLYYNIEDNIIDVIVCEIRTYNIGFLRHND